MLTPTAASIFASYPNLKEQAKEYGEAFVRKDLDRLVELTYPKYVEIVGGKQRLAGIGRQTAKEMEAADVQLLSWSPIEATQLMEESNRLYAVVSMAMRTKVRDVLQESYDCLIGVSTDRGEQWTFVTSTCVRPEGMFPEVANKLTICPEKQAVRIAN